MRRVRRERKKDLDLEAVRYHVYHLLDANGDILYIGRSCDPLQRLKGHHATGAEWPTRVMQIEGHGPYTWDEAVRLEREAILHHKPPHNIDGVTKKTGRKVELVKAS